MNRSPGTTARSVAASAHLPGSVDRPVGRPVDGPVDGVSAAVGRTPLVRLAHLFPASDVEIFAKLESANPGGSAKDRPALAMVRDALRSGRLRPGGTVVESSSGNLGVALARVCGAHGIRFVCVVDTRANVSTRALIRALGGEVDLVTEPDPATGDLLTARVHRVEELLREIPGAVTLGQYSNPANPGAHHDTMREIAEATGGRLDVMMSAVSTTGTISGCARYIREQGLSTRTVAVDSIGSVLFGGTAGVRQLPGMGAGMVTELSRRVEPDRVMRVDSVDCVVGARLLAEREGILAGASTGGVVHALGTLVGELAPGTRVAFIVHDGGAAYLDTVYDDDWVGRVLDTGPDQLATASAALRDRATRG